jgi:hypothetical protein
MNALYQNSTGSWNTAIGVSALLKNLTGDFNTAVGALAYQLNAPASYSNSTGIGYYSSITADNQVRIGNSSVTSIGGQVDWTTLSDERFKKNISESVPGLNFIKKLRPVTYHLDMDAIASFLKTPDSLRLKEGETLKAANLQTGFIAQEVEKAAADLSFDFSGVDKPKNANDYYGLRYAEFVVPLVKAVQEQQVMIEELKIEIERLKKQTKELQTSQGK